MDFETFRIDFERFTKIDTPEKLSICEKQYEKHLLYIEDQKYFEPEIEQKSDDILSKYGKSIRQILKVNDIKVNEFAFLIQPSFEPECLLTITKISDTYSLTFKELESNYWAKVYSNIDLSVNIQTSQINIPATIGSKLFALLNQTINDAKTPITSSFTLDGVKYYLSKLINGEIKTVAKHSPDENSKTGKIITTITFLIKYIKSSDSKQLEIIESNIDNIDD